MDKRQEMKEEAKAAIIQALQDGYTGYYADLHNDVFNTGYYIIGTYQAEQLLNEYGVWEAIREIQEYEKTHFGRVYTDLGNPEHVANMLYYIIGEEALNELMDGVDEFCDNWDNLADEETNTKILQAIKEKQKAG